MKWSRLAILAAVLIVAALAWFTALTLTVYAEVGGPCPMPTEEDDRGMTVLGWSWSDLGYVCVLDPTNGEDQRYVVRWFG